MVEGGGPDSGAGSKPASSFESVGGRLRFTVELRPGETTIVSWKKLLKEVTSSKNKGPGPSSSEANKQPVSQPPPLPPPVASSSAKQPPQDEEKDSQAQPGSNRLSTVIEKIERMYAGNSSEEEDVFLDDVPDDDEYDTEDSFIDDTELDDYFQVDNSTIKHDGFFVNRGKLERIEPTVSISQQPKKRRRKDAAKGLGGNDDGHNPNKQVKLGNKDVVAAASAINAAEVSLKKKTSDTKITADPSGLMNGVGIRQDKDSDQKKTGILSSMNQNSKWKENNELQDASTQRSNDISSNASKSHSGKQPNNAEGVDQNIQRKEKGGGLVERFDLNVPASRDSLQITKTPLMQRKEGSNVRPKSSLLDKAIRELEKIVTESRPPSTEVQDPDNPSQVKRRLPPEIKQKLAKVARLAQASYGKIPKDVINRLMSIIGHLMQLRTLKRNLKIMANMGLSAKQEKDDRLQKIKQEVADMVAQRIPHLKQKIENQSTNSDDFQEAGPVEKEILKRKYTMDDALENKICDLYDLYVERQEEDSGLPAKRIYQELVPFWPSGAMDTDGIRRAIYRARERRKAMSIRRKDQEIKKKKKALIPKTGNTIQGEAINITQQLHMHEKLLSDSRSHASDVMSKPVLSHSLSESASFANVPNVDKMKQERLKGTSSTKNPIDSLQTDVLLPKKKVKRKPNKEAVEAQFRLEKAVATQADDRQKHHQHVAVVALPKPNIQPPSAASAPPGPENTS